MSRIERAISENNTQAQGGSATSFHEEWKALPKLLRQGIDRGLRGKKVEHVASEAASGLGVLGAIASCYAFLRYVPHEHLAEDSLGLIAPALPGLLVSILSGTHAEDVKNEMNDYRRTAIHVIKTHQPDWLVNPPAKKGVGRLLQTPVALVKTESTAQF